MSGKARDQVEHPHAHDEIGTARNMSDAANAGQSLQGYASINGLHEESEIARIAFANFERRQREGQHGSAETDWSQAVEECRRRTQPSE